MQPMRFIMILLVCHLSNATLGTSAKQCERLSYRFFWRTPDWGKHIALKVPNNGTVSDLDGKFTVTAKTGDILHISYVGYISQEIKAEEE